MVTMLPCQCPSILGKFLHPQFYIHAHCSEVSPKSDSCLILRSPLRRVNSSAHRKSFCDFTPWAKLGEVRVDNPAVGCSDVLNIYKETLSRRLMANSLIISTSLVRESEVIDDQLDSLVNNCENTIWVWPPKSLRFFGSGSGWLKRSTGGADPRRGVPQETCPALGGQ